MKKLFLPSVLSMIFLTAGCISIPADRIYLYDSNDTDSAYEINFNEPLENTEHTMRLELLNPTQFENTAGIKAGIKNSTDSLLKIRIYLEDENLKVLSLSEANSIAENDEKVIYFEINNLFENEEAAYLTFCIEGTATAGAISIEAIEAVR